MPCDVTILGSFDSAHATVVAEGSIHLVGLKDTLTPYVDHLSLLSGEGIEIDGSYHAFEGSLHAPNGTIDIDDSHGTYHCGMVGKEIEIHERDNTIKVDSECLLSQ